MLIKRNYLRPDVLNKRLAMSPNSESDALTVTLDAVWIIALHLFHISPNRICNCSKGSLMGSTHTTNTRIISLEVSCCTNIGKI